MGKEKSYNPVQAQRKADKAKAIKKGKAEQVSRRNEKFARRNPHRIEKEIDELKAITRNGGKLTRQEEQTLENLEKDLRAVTRAREALGENAPAFRAPREGGHGVLGKRRRGHEDASSSEEDVSEDVKRIPMPRDTPPPIPKDILDKWWAKRRARLAAERGEPKEGEKEKTEKPPPEPVAPKTVYEAKPIVRDLQKEAVKAFVPTSVQMKMNKGKGKGGLMEPEEADRLEKEGYIKSTATAAAPEANEGAAGPRKVTMEEVDDDED